VKSQVLQVNNIIKTIGKSRRLLGIDSLTIFSGSCLLLTGPNGSGKTTLLKILSGLEPPDKGSGIAEIFYRGHRMPWTEARRRVFRDVIYLHQQAYLFNSSVLENVRYGLRRRGVDREEIAVRVRRALDWAGLSHLASRNARELSGGEKQRVALTRALVLQPRVLLLDEPFSGLDENARSRTGFLIQRIKSEGVAVVVTSHELHPVAGIADKHMELQDGRLEMSERNYQPGTHGARNYSTSPWYGSNFIYARSNDEAG
jgi:tungstate transport system ATP-binding protein